MENASLRIKFKPILKNFGNKNSKCTIEIVPEVSGFQNFDKLEWTMDNGLVEYTIPVSGFQNLDKLEWKMDQGLIEYTIPMTYKIYMKKVNDWAEVDDEKTYYSCVDLLHGYSLSNTNLASGDVSRIISDNFILSKVTSNTERCDIILTKKDTCNSKKKRENLCNMIHKTESIQTLDMEELKDSQSTVDRSNQIDIRRESLLVVKKVSETMNFMNSTTLNKSNETHVTEENNSKRNASNRKSSKQRLSLTPMLSIDTYETEPLDDGKQKKATIFERTVSEKNIFKEFVQSLSGGGRNCDPVFKMDNDKYFEYIVRDKADNILQPLSDNSYQHKGKKTEKTNSDSINPAKIYVNQKYQKLKHTALNDIIYETQNYDNLQAMGVNDFNIIWNPNNYNQSRFIELQNTVVTLQGNDCKNDQKISQKSPCVKIISSRVKSKDKDSFAIDTMKTIKPSTSPKFRVKNVHVPENLELKQRLSDVIITNKSKNDYSKSDCAANQFFSNKLSKWVSQNARVCLFDKYLEKEINPLVTELNDIRNRCISYGFFTRDMVPYLALNTYRSLPRAQRENKMIGNQTFPKFEKEINKNQVTKYSNETSLNPQNKVAEFQRRKKPNRMVYSILFDD